MPIAPHDYIIVLRVLVDVAKLANDSGSGLKAWFVGRKILVTGPSRAGKTIFRNYLREGILEPERRRDRTPATESGKSFSVKPVQGTPLELEVRAIVDVPGQHMEEQVDAFETHRPDAILLILDASMELDTFSFQPENHSLRTWIENYCEQVADRLQRDRKLAANLSNFFVILNKKDKVAVPAELDRREGDMKALLSARLRRGWGSKVDGIEVFRCCSVQNSEGSVAIDATIREIARKVRMD